MSRSFNVFAQSKRYFGCFSNRFLGIRKRPMTKFEKKVKNLSNELSWNSIGVANLTPVSINDYPIDISMSISKDSRLLDEQTGKFIDLETSKNDFEFMAQRMQKSLEERGHNVVPQELFLRGSKDNPIYFYKVSPKY
jgi:hypothetical protein